MFVLQAAVSLLKLTSHSGWRGPSSFLLNREGLRGKIAGRMQCLLLLMDAPEFVKKTRGSVALVCCSSLASHLFSYR